MKNAPRVLGTLSLLAALGSIGFQLLVVARLWAAFVETLSLTSTLALSAAGALLGLVLAVVAVILRRGSVGLLAPLAGLANLGLLAAYAYVFTIL
ncbi:hypothetical protein [Microbacterium trichothecenolyticum]|uniref:Major facilitator superfamily (MFS) profile domain-containing protein n=1 Tax=Microbacterium trichothecenolyticum TaxID=69370 RepID=A0ABU0TUN1_MICTR|nr:hypothetical protein [Microbacterium trichothecenolyticum]MDQ1123344.1 hypothetical protein [Microbacterium trichothecenolyticum]